jgi:cytochrome b6-f complex iron-sulfur subunit
MTRVFALSSGDAATIVVVVVVALFAILLVGSFVRARRSEAELAAAGEEAPREAAPAPPPERAPRAPRAVTRREFFRRSLVGSLGIFAAQFGGASIAFLWPNLKGGFGSTINAGQLTDIKNQIQQTNQPFYVGVGRFYIVPYNGSGKDEATGTDYEAEGVVKEGLMPLYQRCVHLGCRVPFCQQSQWFECPCHGSKYNKAGEYQLGPAPHGMDRFTIDIDSSGNVMVNTSTIITGPPRGTDTTHQSPQGPFCVAPG